jgi:hypothetical protein
MPAGGAAPAGAATLTSLSPVTATPGDTTLTAIGTNFGNSCLINWNGAPIATTLTSATELTATVAIPVGFIRVTLPMSVTCGGIEAGSQLFSVAPGKAASIFGPATNCWLFPTRHDCMNWGTGADDRTKEITNLNSFFLTNGSLSFFNQIKSTYNAAASSTTLSVDLASLNFLNGMQWTVTTNAEVGSSNPAEVASGTVPTLSGTSAAQAAQNMLWGGTVLTSVTYPLFASGAANLPSPGGFGVMVDFIAKAGVDLQTFKASTNVNVTAPPFHGSGQLEGYFIYNAINPPKGASSGIAGSLFGGFTYGYAYTSHGYARDYGFGNAVHIAMGEVSAGIVLDTVATITVTRGFGPSQSYIDNTGMVPVHMNVNNFKTWSLGITYQKAPSK